MQSRKAPGAKVRRSGKTSNLEKISLPPRFSPRLLWLLSASAILSLVVFAHTLSYQFVWDDNGQILRNPWLRDLSYLGKLFTTDVWAFTNDAPSNYYRPLHMLLYMGGYGIFGLAPAGFHFLSAVIHAACVILVGMVAWRITADTSISFASSLLFALNPAHCESIAWIAAVTDPLCALFYFAALLFYLNSENRITSVAFWMSAVFFFLALLSKEMAFTFPAVAFWADWSLRREFRWSRYAALLGIFILYSIMRITALGAFFVRHVTIELHPYARLLSMLKLIADYLAKMFFPFDLNAFHVFRPVTSSVSREFAWSVLVLGLIGIAAWRARKHRTVLFGCGFAVITLAPVMNISGLFLNVFADRYLYIPSFASALLIPFFGRWLWSLWNHRVRISERALGAVCLALFLGGNIFQIARTTFMWRDEQTLYSETLKRSPSADVIASLLGKYYYSHGEYELARNAYNRALESWNQSFIKSKPNLAVAYSGLGGVNLKEGKYEEARAYFLKAYEIAPNRFFTLRDLGAVHIALAEYDRAEAYYRRSLAINSNDEMVYSNLGVIALARGRYDDAIEFAGKALHIHPQLAEAYLILGRAYKGKGMKEEARAAYLTAAKVDPTRSGLVESELRSLEGSPDKQPEPGSTRHP